MRIRSLLTLNFVLLILYAQIDFGETVFISTGLVLMSILGGFLLGQVALTGFMILLMAVVPPDEARSLRSISFQPETATHHHRVSRSISPDSSFPSALQPSDSMKVPSRRNGKFLASLLRTDPMNCMPQVMCELSSATEPTDSSGTLNDYMYVMNEILRPDDDDDESGKPKKRSSSKFQGNKQSSTKKKRPVKKNESDEDSSGSPEDVSKPSEEVEVQGRAELVKMEEDDEIEGQALVDLVNEDPGDIAYAFADMKKRDKIKDMVKNGEFKELESYEEPGPDGLFEFGYLPRFDEGSYDRNVMRLKKSLREGRALRRSSMRNSRAVQESFVERKKRELQQTDDLIDRVRVGAEVGDFTRSARQCRALFNRCSTPQTGINKAVNTLRRAIVGTPLNGRKNKGGLSTNELKLLISELKNQQNSAPRGTTDVKVVLNIGGQPANNQVIQAANTPVATLATQQTFVPTEPYSPPPPPPTQNPSKAFAQKLEGLQSFLEKQAKEAQTEDANKNETPSKNGKKPLSPFKTVAVTASTNTSSQNSPSPAVFKLDLLPQFETAQKLANQPNPAKTIISNDISNKIKKLSKLIDRKIKKLENSDESGSLESSEEISQEIPPAKKLKATQPTPTTTSSKPKPKTQEKGKYKVTKNKNSTKSSVNVPTKKPKTSPKPGVKNSQKKPTLKQPRIAIPSPDFYQNSEESYEAQQYAPYPSFNSFVEQAHHLLFSGRQVVPLPQDPRYYVPSAQRHAYYQHQTIVESPQMTLQGRRGEQIGHRQPSQFPKPAYRFPFQFGR